MAAKGGVSHAARGGALAERGVHRRSAPCPAACASFKARMGFKPIASG